MKILIVALLILTTTAGQAQDYEPGTLEALQYLNNEWVQKPQQRAHERQLMQIRSNGNSFQGNTQDTCQMVPQYSPYSGALIGYIRQCF